MKCPVCKAKFDYPYKRGGRSRFCSPLCRAVHRKKWRKKYDAQEHLKASRRKSSLAWYYRQKEKRDNG